MRVLKVVHAAGTLFILAMTLKARIGPVLNLSALVQESEVIVVGEVTGLTETGKEDLVENGTTWQVKRVSANVRVTETLKGESVPETLRLNFRELHDDNFGDGPPLPATDAGYRMLFLRRNNGTYQFADAVFGAIPVMPSCSATSTNVPDDYAKVLRRAACALSSSDATAADRRAALNVVGMENSPVVRDLFAAALKSDGVKHDAGVRQDLIAALLRGNYKPAIGLAEEELFAGTPSGETNGRVNILLGLQFVDASQSVPLLARALELPESDLRQTAARAMQSTESASGINPLLRALNDRDPEVQFYVMQSLGYLNHELEWRPHSSSEDAFWKQCFAHWQALARERLGKI